MMNWISVKDRLPVECESIIITDGVVVVSGYYFPIMKGDEWTEFFYGNQHNGSFYNVTHWMPLPEPPKND